MASIKKRDDGRYRARYRDAAGVEHSKHFKTKLGKGGAQAWLDEKTVELGTNTWVDPKRGKITVGAWAEKWLASRVDLKPKTEDGYRSLWETQIKPTWARVPLEAVAHADVAEWVAALHSEGLSASRTRQAAHLFGAMLADAVADRRLANNPAANLKLPRMPRPKNRYHAHTTR